MSKKKVHFPEKDIIARLYEPEDARNSVHEINIFSQRVQQRADTYHRNLNANECLLKK